ncbi:Cyclic di-GMP phosphodiesterase response regulator RpfG [Rosistilla carotiformis]|uniref:Cyclic di-GMP phosphodiesterase response regulator RpfG n=1 Tax=Rosistilla carotiformis TaxID=2528017 RepID=A0A518K004_9BACT|nr:HD domain-containing phosphohydrolase [Rosistilla carotiformis]QDV71055.1 Cyclic di-GMP phosphodiesterase response regulator RpfG [Rosistilla carotiformis]
MGTLPGSSPHLSVGQPLQEDILSSNGDVLYRAGEVVTAEIVERIERHGLRRVLQDSGEAVAPSLTSGIHRQQRLKLANVPYSQERAEVLKRLIDESTQKLTELAQSLHGRGRVDWQSLTEIPELFGKQSAKDIDQTLSSTLHQSAYGELSSHCLTLSTLGMMIAQEIPGCNEEEILDVGIAGSLHEMGVGELELGPEARSRRSELSASDFATYSRHPIVAHELCSSITGLSSRARQGMLHVHEQLDGSGFPHGVGGQQINRIARILNVADAYLTLQNPLDGRPAIKPYDALVCLLYQVRAGRCDAEAVRGLLNLVSLFPLGSFVRLDDSRVAKVIRSNSPSYTKPTVVTLDTEELINLREANHRIVAIEANPSSQEIRLQPDELKMPYWIPSVHKPQLAGSV